MLRRDGTRARSVPPTTVVVSRRALLSMFAILGLSVIIGVGGIAGWLQHRAELRDQQLHDGFCLLVKHTDIGEAHDLRAQFDCPPVVPYRKGEKPAGPAGLSAPKSATPTPGTSRAVARPAPEVSAASPTRSPGPQRPVLRVSGRAAAASTAQARSGPRTTPSTSSAHISHASRPRAAPSSPSLLDVVSSAVCIPLLHDLGAC